MIPATPALDLESALLEGGLLLENAGRYAEADEWYRALGDVSPWVSDDAFALHRSGAVRLQQDDMPGVREAWTQLLVDHPGHWRAVEAYDGLIAEGIAVEPLVAGLYFYRQSRFDDATAVYEALLDGHPTAAETGVALYYLAAIDEDLGAGADAIEGYLASVAADPDGPQADNALWWAGPPAGGAGLEHPGAGRLRAAGRRLPRERVRGRGRLPGPAGALPGGRAGRRRRRLPRPH